MAMSGARMRLLSVCPSVSLSDVCRTAAGRAQQFVLHV